MCSKYKSRPSYPRYLLLYFAFCSLLFLQTDVENFFSKLFLERFQANFTTRSWSLQVGSSHGHGQKTQKEYTIFTCFSLNTYVTEERTILTKIKLVQRDKKYPTQALFMFIYLTLAQYFHYFLSLAAQACTHKHYSLSLSHAHFTIAPSFRLKNDPNTSICQLLRFYTFMGWDGILYPISEVGQKVKSKASTYNCCFVSSSKSFLSDVSGGVPLT